jgi:hypothetical protein
MTKKQRKSNLKWLKKSTKVFTRKKLKITKKSSEIYANIDFKILWGYLKKRYRELFLIKKTRRLPIWCKKVLLSNKWDNKYELHIEIMDSHLDNRIDKRIIPIEYNWWNDIKTLNYRWKYSNTFQIKSKNQYNRNRWKTLDGNTRWFLEIETSSWDLVLFLDLTKKRENYHKRRKKHD